MMSLSRGEAYSIIELPIGADPDSIRANYKRLATKWHPDKHRGANYNEALWKFQQVSQAYKRLITDHDVTSMTLEEMYQLYQQIFHKAQPASHHTANGFDDSNDDCDSGSDDAKDGALHEVHNNGTHLTEEERERRKSEKRKAKKKQRKEKKKLEKQGDSSKDENSEGGLKQNNGDIHGNHFNQTSDHMTGSDSENFDASSAFYNKVVTKKKKSTIESQPSATARLQQPELRQPESNHYVQPPPEEGWELDPVVLQSRQLAIQGNEMANLGEYHQAIDLFTTAIRLDPRDFRFFGNRSYCYDRIHQYDKALQDAEHAILLAPEWPKGYFRKGRALAGKKMYVEAEQSFIQVLKLDSKCDDAVQELNRIRIQQLTDMGFTTQQAEAALTQYPTFPQALDSLLSGLAGNGISLSNTAVRNNLSPAPPVGSGRQSTAPLYPIPQHNYNQAALKVQQKPVAAAAVGVDVKMDPANPEGLSALWVGNVLPEVSDKKLCQMFSKYGAVSSVRCLPEKFCAFINFKDKDSAAKALKNLQGIECAGQRLLIKFPDNPVTAGNIVIKKSASSGANSSNITAAKKTQPAASNGRR